MKVIAKTTGMTRTEWLQFRQNGIGGSDVSGIAGMNKYTSPMGVYLSKVTPIDEQNDTAGEAAYWGNELEEVVAKEFQKRSGLKVRRRNEMLAHDEHDFMIANLDRVIVGKKQILECKTASIYMAKEWEGDGVPAGYYLQIMHYLAVTGYEGAWVAVLIGGQKFVYKYIERDEDVIENIVKVCSDFWHNHVIPKVPPAYDGSEASGKLLGQLFPSSNADVHLVMTDEYDALIDQYTKAADEEKAAKTVKAEAENKMKALIGEAEKAIGQTHVVEWKNVKGRDTVDGKSLKTDDPELYQKYLKPGKPTRRFAVKQIEDKGAI